MQNLRTLTLVCALALSALGSSAYAMNEHAAKPARLDGRFKVARAAKAALRVSKLAPAVPELDDVYRNILGNHIHANFTHFTAEDRTWMASKIRLALAAIAARPTGGYAKDDPIRRSAFRGVINSRKALELALDRITFDEQVKLTDPRVKRYLQLQAHRPTDAQLETIAAARDYAELHKALTHASQAPYYGKNNSVVSYSNFGFTPAIRLANRIGLTGPEAELPEGLTTRVVAALRDGQAFTEEAAKPLALFYDVRNRSNLEYFLNQFGWKRSTPKDLPGMYLYQEPLETAVDGKRGEFVVRIGQLGDELRDYSEEERTEFYRAVYFHQRYVVVEN